MYIPEPYFKNVPKMGDLVMDHIFFENGYPILFTCKNNNNLYLCLCRTIVDEQLWVISEIDLEILEKLLNNEISIYESFKTFQSEERRSCIAKWKKEFPSEEYSILWANQIQDADLPNSDLYLDDEGESAEYLEIVKNRLATYESKRLESLITSSECISEAIIERFDYTFRVLPPSLASKLASYAVSSHFNLDDRCVDDLPPIPSSTPSKEQALLIKNILAA